MARDDKPLKSAYELAMERLKAQEAKTGAGRVRPLTDEQKKKITRLREESKAKLAELEILHRDRLAAATGDPEKLAEEQEHYRTDRRRVESSLESAIARVKRGDG